MPTVPIRDINVYYEESGSGEPLILIMGLGGDLQAWALQVPALARHFRVITLDNRGAGRTSSPDKPYSIAGMAEDVAGLMDHLGIARANVLGFSMGGYIAQELALRHADKVDKLILLATAPYIDGYGENIVKSWINVRRSNMSRENIQRLTATWLYSAALFDDPARGGALLDAVSFGVQAADYAIGRVPDGAATCHLANDVLVAAILAAASSEALGAATIL